MIEFDDYLKSKLNDDPELKEELEDDIYCERLLDEYLEDPNPDKHEAMSLENFAKSEGIDI